MLTFHLCYRLPPHARTVIRKRWDDWLFQQFLGEEDGSWNPLPSESAPPKAGSCMVLINPVYKFILVKNTKVAGTSIFVKFGGFCPEGITYDDAKVPCNVYFVTKISKLPLLLQRKRQIRLLTCFVERICIQPCVSSQYLTYNVWHSWWNSWNNLIYS